MSPLVTCCELCGKVDSELCQPGFIVQVFHNRICYRYFHAQRFNGLNLIRILPVYDQTVNNVFIVDSLKNDHII